jgi:carbon-monoxide dehydrogenase iron sulfur subunit
MKTVFVNPERCIGCRQCEFACRVAHSASGDPVSALFEEPTPRTRVHVAPGKSQFSSFPVKCRHCDPAPCQQVCPTGAIFRDSSLDLELIDVGKCINCAMCAMVCPFDALTFQPQRDGTEIRMAALKCDGCETRVRDGREPACSEVCKVNALVFGEVDELVAAGRLHQAHAVLAKVNQLETEAEAPLSPPNVSAWRAWGSAAATVREEQSHG